MTDTKPKILFIDDEKYEQQAFQRILTKENLPYDCTYASSVKEAHEILTSQNFDVVIIDYSLGDGTGFELMDYVKKSLVIFSTGSGNENIAVKAMKAGAYDYIVKDTNQNYLTMLPLSISKALAYKASVVENERLNILYREVVQNSFNGIVVTDSSGKIIMSNPVFQHLSEIPYDKILGSNIVDIISGKQFFEYLTSTLTKEPIYNLETVLFPVHSSTIPIALSASAIENGNLIIITIKNLKAEKELSQENLLYRSFALRNIFISMFKVGFIGPELVVNENLPFLNPETYEANILKMGVFYSTTINQGEKTHAGLFGPFPIPETKDYVSLVYATELPDAANTDERANGKSPTLVVFSMLNSFVHLFSNRRSIEAQLKTIFESKSIQDIKDITLNFLLELKPLIIELPLEEPIMLLMLDSKGIVFFRKIFKSESEMPRNTINEFIRTAQQNRKRFISSEDKKGDIFTYSNFYFIFDTHERIDFCYIFKGNPEEAQKKLFLFIQTLTNKLSIWNSLVRSLDIGVYSINSKDSEFIAKYAEQTFLPSK